MLKLNFSRLLLIFCVICSFAENENSVFEFMESMNTPANPNDVKSYRMSMIGLGGGNSSGGHSKIGKNRSSNMDSSLIGINNLPQNRSKKLGAIMGIVKRSRSIHNPDWCPSKNYSFL